MATGGKYFFQLRLLRAGNDLMDFAFPTAALIVCTEYLNADVVVMKSAKDRV